MIGPVGDQKVVHEPVLDLVAVSVNDHVVASAEGVSAQFANAVEKSALPSTPKRQ